MIAFGPVPSRRLGRSLGVNNIPPKICPYSCVYCQLGRTSKKEIKRRPFYSPREIFQDVREKVKRAEDRGEAIDYVTFVPDGEPTLELHLGREIDIIKRLGIEVAVITNASLIWNEDVREDLRKADWVSLKVDCVDVKTWRKVNRPHSTLDHEAILRGILEFAKSYEGTLATETMLVRDLNDDRLSIGQTADFLAEVNPDETYISVPTRPPAEGWVRPPPEIALNETYQVIAKKLRHVEYLVGYEGDAFSITGDLENDLLAITAVHPMREDAIRKLVARAGSGWSAVQRLIDEGRIVETEYEGTKYYVRMLSG